jgi:peptidoglycan/xylan/chitin deacetylase (PgdA/CDA1 family)
MIASAAFKNIPPLQFFIFEIFAKRCFVCYTLKKNRLEEWIMDWEIVYPGGCDKALTLSYDDGQIYDRRLVEIFDRYGVKATFHLNSGKLDTPGFVSSDEIAALYANHEVACHGVRHEWLTQLPPERLVTEIWEDRRALEHIMGYPVRGYSYAFGVYSNQIADVLRALGIEYARTTDTTGNFTVPANPLIWHPSAHHNDDIAALAESLLSSPAYRKLPLLYVWGHSYEFERNNNWNVIEHFCETLSGHTDIWYTTNLEYIRYLRAMRGLVCSVDSHRLYNPFGLSVWIRSGRRQTELPPGRSLSLNDFSN